MANFYNSRTRHDTDLICRSFKPECAVSYQCFIQTIFLNATKVPRIGSFCSKFLKMADFSTVTQLVIIGQDKGKDCLKLTKIGDGCLAKHWKKFEPFLQIVVFSTILQKSSIRSAISKNLYSSSVRSKIGFIGLRLRYLHHDCLLQIATYEIHDNQPINFLMT